MKLNNFGLLLAIVAVTVWSVSAQADLKQIKAYKEAFPEAKPKCIECHTDEKPKKEDGQHDPNDYGQAAMKAAEEAKTEENKPTADIYKKIGSIEKFAK